MKMLIRSKHLYSKETDRGSEIVTFAMGMDMSANLQNITNSGIVRSVVSLLQNDYGISLSELQRKLDAAIEESELNKQSLNYGDCILIDLPEITGGRFKLLFIINSRHVTASVTDTNMDDVEGEDSRKIIIDLFNFISEKRLPNVVLGAFGTNGLAFPYRVILNEISNSYIYGVSKNFYPHNVFLSLREQDLKYHKLNMSDVITEVRQNLNNI